jgi:4-hydroxybenzoate polyprenyltransferase/phosphoserine phosphatase
LTNPTPSGAPKTVLAVDLDGTLCRTDTLHEALFATLTAHPAALPGMVSKLSEGKAAFKAKVVETTVLPASGLPMNAKVIEVIEAARADGREVVLVTASDKAQAEAIATELGLFDRVIATGMEEVEGVNLGGSAKADYLEKIFGPKGFDYIGNDFVDVPVWAKAARALTVGASEKLNRAAQEVNANVVHLDPPQSGTDRALTALRAMRPHQWSKNLLIFLPMFAAHNALVFPAALAAFVAFSLLASSVYVLNDLVDLSADRAHPRKRTRPFAAGEIPISHGLLLAVGLIVVALLVAILFTPPAFLLTLGSYYIITFAYSLWLKRKLIIDVIVLAGLYTWRLIGGSVATEVELTPWMLGFSMFLFLALAAVKRQAELTDFDARGIIGPSPGRAYMSEDLPMVRSIAIAAGHASVMVLALYIASPDILKLYKNPVMLWALCPLVLYWLLRMVMVTHRGRMTDDPIVFAAKDWVSRGIILTAAAVILIAATGFPF